MKLRGRLVVSHMALVLTATLLIGTVNLFLALRSTANTERAALRTAADLAAAQLQQRHQSLRRAAQDAAVLALRLDTRSPFATTVALNELLQRHRCERVELFLGLEMVADAWRWERGSHPSVRTTWLPTDPRVAGRIAGGLEATWVQRAGEDVASLKVCVPMARGRGTERGWVVVSEPLDGTLLSSLAPQVDAVSLLVGERPVATWPATLPRAAGMPPSPVPDEPRRGIERLFSPVTATAVVGAWDGGRPLSLQLQRSAAESAATLKRAVRAWFLVTVGGLLVAWVLGSSLAARLIAPLQALLEGTAAMARGHFMVRLQPQGQDELAALTTEFNRMADELRRTYMGVILTLAEVVEAKSRYTREHIERVERLALATADALERRGWARFSSQRRFILSVAAVLHDVGKISIPGEILNKSGPLSDGERQEILTHPERGALIVERMGKLSAAAEIIRCAHEHFDGSGYPLGLKGEEIPLEARIILAVDAYDAMTADRPYSPRRHPEEAIAELRAEAGRQFDPVVVEALIEAVKQYPDPLSHPSSDTGLYRLLNPEAEPSRPRFSDHSPVGRG